MRIQKDLFLTKICPGERRDRWRAAYFPFVELMAEGEMKPRVQKNPWHNRTCMLNFHSVQFGS